MRGEVAGEERGRREGRTEGQGEALLAIFEARALPVSAAVRAIVVGCCDPATLKRWIARAMTTASAEQAIRLAGDG